MSKKKVVRVTTFETREEALAYGQELWLAWALREMVKKAIADGMVSQN